MNLFRLYNDSILSDTEHTSKVGDGPLRPAIWNRYLAFLRSQSPLTSALVTFLNVATTIEVPLEMIIQKLAGIDTKFRYVIILELLKYRPSFHCIVSSI
jgi:hypothetical protein